MPIINEASLDLTYPDLKCGKWVHIVINNDEMSVATNEQHHRVWLATNQQLLRKKGNGWSIHVSDFILETMGHLYLTETQLQVHDNLPMHQHL